MQLLFFFLLVGVVPRLRSAVIYRTGSGSHASLGRSRHTRVSKKNLAGVTRKYKKFTQNSRLLSRNSF